MYCCVDKKEGGMRCHERERKRKVSYVVVVKCITREVSDKVE